MRISSRASRSHSNRQLSGVFSNLGGALQGMACRQRAYGPRGSGGRERVSLCGWRFRLPSHRATAVRVQVVPFFWAAHEGMRSRIARRPAQGYTRCGESCRHRHASKPLRARFECSSSGILVALGAHSWPNTFGAWGACPGGVRRSGDFWRSALAPCANRRRLGDDITRQISALSAPWRLVPGATRPPSCAARTSQALVVLCRFVVVRIWVARRCVAVCAHMSVCVCVRPCVVWHVVAWPWMAQDSHGCSCSAVWRYHRLLFACIGSSLLAQCGTGGLLVRRQVVVAKKVPLGDAMPQRFAQALITQRRPIR